MRFFRALCVSFDCECHGSLDAEGTGQSTVTVGSSNRAFCITKAESSKSLSIPQLQVQTSDRMKVSLSIAGLFALEIDSAFAAFTELVQHSDNVGWSYEDILEYQNLNTTGGWAEMSKVTYYTAMPGETIDLGHTHGLNRRAGNR